MRIIASQRDLIPLAILFLLVHFFLFQHYGIRDLYDARDYIKDADFLVEKGKLMDLQRLFYVVPIGFMALARIIFPEQILPYLLFQCIISGFAVVALYRASSKFFDNHFAGLLSAMIFLLW